MQLGDKIALRALTLRVRVKSDRNAQAARWSVWDICDQQSWIQDKMNRIDNI